MINLPLTQAEIGRIRAYEPHDSYFLSKSMHGRGAVAVLLLKEGISYPVSTPFWMGINLALLVKKTAQLIFQTIKLVRFSKVQLKRVKVLSIHALDYLCLLGLIPLARGVSLVRKLGALIHPGIYYRRPSLCTWGQQALFYQNRTEELFQKLFRKDGLTKEEKEAIWNLKKQMKKKLHREAAVKAKILLAQDCEHRVRDLDKQVNEAGLQAFKAFLM